MYLADRKHCSTPLQSVRRYGMLLHERSNRDRHCFSITSYLLSTRPPMRATCRELWLRRSENHSKRVSDHATRSIDRERPWEWAWLSYGLKGTRLWSSHDHLHGSPETVVWLELIKSNSALRSPRSYTRTMRQTLERPCTRYVMSAPIYYHSDRSYKGIFNTISCLTAFTVRFKSVTWISVS